MTRRIDVLNSNVVRHKSGNYCRVLSDGGLADPIRDDEVIMYSNLPGKDARILSEKYNRVHAAISKRVYRDYLGLLNSLDIMYHNRPDFTEDDEVITLTILYSYFGIGVFIDDDNLPDRIFEKRCITIPLYYAKDFIERIRTLDIKNKQDIMINCIKETDKLYHKMFNDDKIPLDSIAQ